MESTNSYNSNNRTSCGGKAYHCHLEILLSTSQQGEEEIELYHKNNFSRKRVQFADDSTAEKYSDTKKRRKIEPSSSSQSAFCCSSARKTAIPAKMTPEMMMMTTTTTTGEGYRELWYQPDELAVFKKDIRDLLLNGPSGSVKSADAPIPSLSSGSKTTESPSGNDDDEPTEHDAEQREYNEFLMSGLERYHPERMKHKKRVIRYIYNAQKHRPNDPEFMRRVSVKSSKYARQVALDQAFRNFCDVYDPLGSLIKLWSTSDFF